MNRPGYSKAVEALARAEANVERWTKRTVAAARALADWRREVARIKKRLEKSEREKAALKLCGACGVPLPCRCGWGQEPDPDAKVAP